jgi:hypothetical protein
MIVVFSHEFTHYNFTWIYESHSAIVSAPEVAESLYKSSGVQNRSSSWFRMAKRKAARREPSNIGWRYIMLD